jgi:hypothetical protein
MHHVLNLGHFLFEFVSDFAFRASDFMFLIGYLFSPLKMTSVLDMCYLSLSVLIASSASAMAIIQKRTMTFGSGQPLSSK